MDTFYGIRIVYTSPDELRLDGVIRDFRSDYPDFSPATRPPGSGHYVGNVASTLNSEGRPVFTGSGLSVNMQWYDQHENPIRPYAGPGLPGGHFDVDVCDAERRKYHKHEFDDEYDVNFIDIVNDPHLLFEQLVGNAYPNDLRLEFFNVHNGGLGSYTLAAGGAVQAGETAAGFDTTFDPALITQLQVSFMALAFLRPTDPGSVKHDAVDRDDAFYSRMYDTTTNAMVYEVSVYHHYHEGESFGGTESGLDACGVEINDTSGTYGAAGTGGINNAGTFDEWYRDSLFANQSKVQTITLHRNAAGDYEYQTDSFFPIDDRLIGNEGNVHNSSFTYAISGTFTYNACASQFFEFSGSDDAWVYIDNQLVIDSGGTENPQRQHVALDRLGLVDGQVYRLDFFYANRSDSLTSLFAMRTNLDLATSVVRVVSGIFD